MRFLLIMSALVMGTISGFALCGFRVNLTGSMPRGIYAPKLSNILERNDWVAVCLPKSIANEGLKNGYLMAGTCQDINSMPVLKQLIALPGDIVEVTSTDIIVNGQMYPAKIHTRDHQGRILKRQIFKKSVVDNYWLYGTASENSWDSRYYGGVDRNNIIGIYLPTRLPKWIRQSSRHEETK